MTKFLLSLHVLAAIIAVGPVAVAASMFPRVLRQARDPSGAGDTSASNQLHLLHRVCRVYAAIGMAVPVFGFATASNLGVLGSAWLITAIALTAVAAAVLMLRILPGQQAALTDLAEPAGATGTTLSTRLAMDTGVFNLLWATVTVLMIIRPGSTTGA
ncbi:hypothetical protein [Catenulispora pinisilvae]|uniref:hypothetical protein n=1 Tax=Catenulispora pinisilvae TaxID=2705253 RepID=UPI0018925B53|nr:hypothetical protein [Catenulispora pinisilvae]